CNVGAVVLTGQTASLALYRYLLACFCLPFLTSVLLLRLLPGRPPRAAAALLTAWACVQAGWQVGRKLPGVHAGDFQPPYPPVAQALDRLVRGRGPMRGRAGFWSARSLTQLPRRHVPVATLEPGGPYLHSDTADRCLNEDPADLRLPEYQFLVVTSD